MREVPVGITNDAGEIAIAYHQPAQAYVDASQMPTGRGYVFSVQRAVSLAWVHPDDVQAILDIRKTCQGCGGRRKQRFAYATDGQVSVWTDGTRGSGQETGKSGCGC